MSCSKGWSTIVVRSYKADWSPIEVRPCRDSLVIRLASDKSLSSSTGVNGGLGITSGNILSNVVIISASGRDILILASMLVRTGIAWELPEV